MVNNSLTTSLCPEIWKHAVVIPSFKKGDQENEGNYRSISLLLVVSKNLEKNVSIQLLGFYIKE